MCTPLLDDPFSYESTAHLDFLERVCVVGVETSLCGRDNVYDESLEGGQGFVLSKFRDLSIKSRKGKSCQYMQTSLGAKGS